VGSKIPDEKTFETWVRPKEALEKLIPHFGGQLSSIEIIIRRLSAGSIPAVASKVFEVRKKQTQLMFEIPIDWWQYTRIDHSADNFWLIGDTDVRKPERIAYGNEDSYSLMDVRFEPAAIEVMLPAILAGPPTIDVYDQLENSAGLQPASDAFLNAFYAFYQIVTPPAKQNDEELLRYFKQCLPYKYLSRERLRLLRGDRKRGRRPSGE